MTAQVITALTIWVKAARGYLNIGGKTYSVTKRYNLTASQILANIPSAFAGADSDDVSMFYYCGHGVTGTSSNSGALYCMDESLVLPTALRNALNNVQGTVIVFIDACGSGAYIKSSGLTADTAKASANAFNNAIVSAFAGITEKTGELKTSKYKVLTAAA